MHAMIPEKPNFRAWLFKAVRKNIRFIQNYLSMAIEIVDELYMGIRRQQRKNI